VALLERETQLAALGEFFGEAAGGAGRFVWVSGEAGAGKSTLVDAFVESCTATARVRVGANDPFTTARPLGALLDMVEPDSPIRAAVAKQAPHEAFALLLQELANSDAPTVLVFEDAHWADEATCDLLRYLARRTARLRVLVLVTYRDDQVGPTHPLRLVLGDIAALGGNRRVHVPRLSRHAVAALAASGGLDANQVYVLTGGNAFFVSEIVAARATEVPGSVSDAVLARAARLTPAARSLLDAASVVPGSVEPWLLQEIGDGSGEASDECVLSGILQSDGDALRFRHEIARIAVEQALLPERRRELHARVLALLTALPEHAAVDVARLAHHALAASDPHAVLAYAVPAATIAAGLGAHREAAAHLDAALRHAPIPPGPDRAELLDRHGYECYLTGQVNAAVDSRLEALDQWRAAEERTRVGDELRWLSRLYWLLGKNDEATRFGQDAITTLERTTSTYELAMAYANFAQLAMLEDRVEEATAWAYKAIPMATSLGYDDILSHALNTVGTATYAHGHERGHEQLERSLQLALSNGLEEHAARAYTNLLSLAVKHRELSAARNLAEEALGYCEQRDLGNWTLYVTSWTAQLALILDDWRQARVDATRVVGHPGVSPVSAITALSVLARLHARHGDADAPQLAERALRLARATGEPQRLHVAVVAAAEVAWLTDTPLPASAREQLPHAARVTGVWDSGEIAVWARRLGVDVVIDADPSTAYALTLSGQHQQAFEAWAAVGSRYEAALTGVDSEDPVLIRRSVEWLTQLGATAARDLAVRRLQALGLRGPRPSTAANPAGLTAREVDVLNLVTLGMSNGEISARLTLSKRTIDHHVSAILRKLEVDNRKLAARKAEQLGIVPVR
jgi:DNA-binding CsgD family transcriptional regulator/tetratricopeptide (TPR) repeat protein